jgi:heptosyltransferase-2
MKILVIGPSWVGDMMMSQSLYRTLKARYPQAIIDVMAPAWCRPLLSRMPEVNDAIPMPLGHGALEIGERRKLGHSLRDKRYDRAYVLPNSFKSALVPFFCERASSYRLARRNALRPAERRPRAGQRSLAADGRALCRTGL